MIGEEELHAPLKAMACHAELLLILSHKSLLAFGVTRVLVLHKLVTGKLFYLTKPVQAATTPLIDSLAERY